MERASRLARFVAICGAAAIGSGSAALGDRSPCALSSPASVVAQPPCSPFTVVRPHTIATFFKSRFFGSGPLTTLADGSAVIADAPYALFRIRGDQTGVMWAPWGSHYYDRYGALNSALYWIGSPPPEPSPSPAWTSYYFDLLGSFDNTTVIQYGDYWIYGIATNGATVFRFSRAGTDLAGQPVVVGRDPDGILWFESGSKRFGRNAVYAFDLKTERMKPLATAVENVFQGPAGFIYATLEKNLVVLRSTPDVQAHYYRGPITLDAADVYGSTDFHGKTDIAISRIAADGSAWASTPTRVIHMHRNGKVAVIQLSTFPSVISHPPTPIVLQPAPDSSAWTVGHNKLVRITSDDRVEVMPFPGSGFYPQLRFSPDATVWVTTSNAPTALAHVAPATI